QGRGQIVGHGLVLLTVPKSAEEIVPKSAEGLMPFSAESDNRRSWYNTTPYYILTCGVAGEGVYLYKCWVRGRNIKHISFHDRGYRQVDRSVFRSWPSYI